MSVERRRNGSPAEVGAFRYPEYCWGILRGLGAVRVACPKFEGGSFESLVMPDTSSVISVGGRCLDHGFSFEWPAGENPYLVLPNGKIVDLVVGGLIPYLNMSGREAPGAWNGAVAESAVALDRWCCVVPGAVGYLNDMDEVGGPPFRSIQTRATIDLHAHEVIGRRGCSNSSPPKRVDQTPFGSRLVDAISHVYDTFQFARDLRWKPRPTGIAACAPPPPSTKGENVAAQGGLLSRGSLGGNAACHCVGCG